jgi:putative transposase
MARAAVQDGRATIRHACWTFDLSQTCYRYQANRCDEDAQIADWLMR